MKKLTVTLAGVGLLAVSAVAWWAQNHSAARTPPASAAVAHPKAGTTGPVPVEVARAVARDVSDDTSAVGSLRARQGVMMRPEVSGRIVKLGFADGQRVKTGQLLVQMDDALQRARLLESQAQADIARTTLTRNQELVAQNFVTQSVVDQAQANLNVAEAQVALARAELARLRIVAPFDGQTGIRAVNVGDVVQDGADLVSLQDTSSVYVDFSLPERFTSQLEVKKKVEVSIDSLPGRRFDAVVEALEPQISLDGRALLARGLIPNRDATLRPGMFARVKVQLAERPGAVLVPEEAVVPQAGKELLFKVVDGPDGPLSQRIEVRTGIRRNGEVEILGGLRAGERIVTAGQSRLMRGDGLQLQVVELGGPAGRAAEPPAVRASGASGGSVGGKGKALAHRAD
ncbi:MAG: efflux RND transporter periplasmic adaptor subunit [Methylibium sp.]|uniref:efflux RND transporter periplasmic adaptor subunit n=1 Tax=Methylibium sp. TaxID=2067992 RepID=UPI0017C53EB2|nr:efflux RND transporter periplasmic adaptor subunit [Methylibium sp.]MBA3596202.1 efflux RND transporter periplasmic adaptor subunit [Methylibium sp.]